MTKFLALISSVLPCLYPLYWIHCCRQSAEEEHLKALSTPPTIPSDPAVHPVYRVTPSSISSSFCSGLRLRLPPVACSPYTLKSPPCIIREPSRWICPVSCLWCRCIILVSGQLNNPGRFLKIRSLILFVLVFKCNAEGEQPPISDPLLS